MTTVFPQTSAGIIFHDGIAMGKFHGVINPQTPIGARTLIANLFGSSEGVVWPNRRRPSPAIKYVMSMASCTSPRVSASTLPISRVMSFEYSSLRWTKISAARYKISARFGAGTSRHDLYASFAASTAAFTSASFEATKFPTSSSVLAGLRFSYVFPLFESTHSPPIKFLYTRGATDVAMLPPRPVPDSFFASVSAGNAAGDSLPESFDCSTRFQTPSNGATCIVMCCVSLRKIRTGRGLKRVAPDISSLPGYTAQFSFQICGGRRIMVAARSQEGTLG